MASVSQVPQVSEAARGLVLLSLQAEIQQRELQFIIEGHLLLEALKKAKGSRRLAARSLGTHKNLFNHRLEQMGLENAAQQIIGAWASQKRLGLRRSSEPLVPSEENLRTYRSPGSSAVSPEENSLDAQDSQLATHSPQIFPASNPQELLRDKSPPI
jgi:hypothetical protein